MSRLQQLIEELDISVNEKLAAKILEEQAVDCVKICEEYDMKGPINLMNVYATCIVFEPSTKMFSCQHQDRKNATSHNVQNLLDSKLGFKLDCEYSVMRYHSVLHAIIKSSYNTEQMLRKLMLKVSCVQHEIQELKKFTHGALGALPGGADYDIAKSSFDSLSTQNV